jgi:RimJ/RimL family protein N-acetyltransferase
MLQGKLVRLRAPERGDLPTFVRWFNDPETTQFLLRGPPMSLEGEEQWYASLSTRELDPVFCIETLDGKLIGNIGIMHLDWTTRRAEIGVMIGEKDHWSQGFGTEAISLLLKYMFEELNLERVGLYCDEANLRAQRCYQKCGFRLEGKLRHYLFKNGEYVDDIMMSILRSDWEETNRK